MKKKIQMTASIVLICAMVVQVIACKRATVNYADRLSSYSTNSPEYVAGEYLLALAIGDNETSQRICADRLDDKMPSVQIQYLQLFSDDNVGEIEIVNIKKTETSPLQYFNFDDHYPEIMEMKVLSIAYRRVGDALERYADVVVGIGTNSEWKILVPYELL